MVDNPETPPQLPEAKSIGLGETFDPFKELNRKKIPEAYSSTFRIDDLGTVVFRFSNRVPDESGEYILTDERYVWAEIALDSNLEESKYDEVLQGLELDVTNPVTKREYLGFLENMVPQLDRYKFSTWGLLTPDWNKEVPAGNPVKLLVKEREIAKIKAIVKSPPLPTMN